MVTLYLQPCHHPVDVSLIYLLPFKIKATSWQLAIHFMSNLQYNEVYLMFGKSNLNIPSVGVQRKKA